MMKQYETLLLARTEITNDELSMIERHFDKVLAAVDGSINSFDKWGKIRLAYPVDTYEYGFYVLARYKLPSQAVSTVLKEIDTFIKLKCDEIVFRHVTKCLPANASSSYPRPDSVDTARSGGFDSFLKENKMDLLKSVPSDREEISMDNYDNDDSAQRDDIN